jgi:hypothetical protein
MEAEILYRQMVGMVMVANKKKAVKRHADKEKVVKIQIVKSKEFKKIQVNMIEDIKNIGSQEEGSKKYRQVKIAEEVR